MGAFYGIDPAMPNGPAPGLWCQVSVTYNTAMRRMLGQAALRWIVGLVLAAGVAVGAAVALLRYFRPEVEVALVSEGPVVQAFYATGTLGPEREFPINSNVEGIIERLSVDKGQPVRKDEEVAFIRVPEYEYRYAQAMAELKLKQSLANEESSPQLKAFDLQLQRLEEQLKTAEREVKRLTGMMETGAASLPRECRSARRGRRSGAPRIRSAGGRPGRRTWSAC